ncbi:AraC family transcriptional regulator [Planomicrobium sp. Y74]|uniref:AraC family transcriptional regulator n=1 Tax=Planomicrobium sp. Y74 TaxID=2478977 RepID=UPI0013144AA6|nr:AraC family transcriptional regulator [Planomicrobium sp. Y74]
MTKHYREKAAHNWSEDSIRLITTPSRSAKNSFFYVEEAGYFQTKPGYFTEREKLNSYLIVYTLDGKGFLTYHGQKYKLQKNQAFFISCMDYQHYKTDQEELWEFNWVHLNGSSIRGYYHYFQSADSPVVTIKNSSDFKSSFQQLIQNQQNFTAHSEPISSKLLTDLLTELLCSVHSKFETETYIPDAMQAIIRYLEKYFNTAVSLDHLAARFNLSKYHLAREFKKYAGISPHEFLITCRITYAKNALKYSNDSISEIAEDAGIPNVSHFINLFKDREGTTPLAYRKKWRI